MRPVCTWGTVAVLAKREDTRQTWSRRNMSDITGRSLAVHVGNPSHSYHPEDFPSVPGHQGLGVRGILCWGHYTRHRYHALPPGEKHPGPVVQGLRTWFTQTQGSL